MIMRFGGGEKDTTQFLFNCWFDSTYWDAALITDLKGSLQGGDTDGSLGTSIPELNQVIFPLPGVIDLMTFALGLNTNDQIITITTFLGGSGGADGNQIITIGAGLTGVFQDVTNNDVLGVNAEVCYNHNKPAGVGTAGRPQATMRYVR